MGFCFGPPLTSLVGSWGTRPRALLSSVQCNNWHLIFNQWWPNTSPCYLPSKLGGQHGSLSCLWGLGRHSGGTCCGGQQCQKPNHKMSMMKQSSFCLKYKSGFTDARWAMSIYAFWVIDKRNWVGWVWPNLAEGNQIDMIWAYLGAGLSDHLRLGGKARWVISCSNLGY